MNRFKRPLDIHLKPSMDVAIALATMHLSVAVAIFFLSSRKINTALFLLILISIALSYLYYYRWHVVRTLEKSVREIHISARDDWFLVNSSGQKIAATVLQNSFISNTFLVLNFRSAHDDKYTVLLTKNMIDCDRFRRLKVRLKTQKVV